MKTSIPPCSLVGSKLISSRGSVLIVALLFAAAIAISLGSYLRLSSNSLKLAHRTFLANSAVNLAETGIEEAVWSFNKMGNETDPLAPDFLDAWSGTGRQWNLGNTISDVYMASTGSGYTSAPTVSFSGGGAVTQATGTAYITTSNDESPLVPVTRVTRVAITNPGSGYTSEPTVTLTGGGGSGATAVARLAATRTLTFNNLEGGASGTVKVYVAGYNGTAVVPIILAKASITPADGPPVEKIVKVILSKNGVLPKGLVSFNGIDWNGHPLADSYLSSPSPGTPPFLPYDEDTARANTTVASLDGTIDLANGDVEGNVMTGEGVTVVGRGDISGETIGNFTFPFTLPTPPPATYNDPVVAGALAPVLPRLVATVDPITGNNIPPDVPTTIDGKVYYCYSVTNATIGALTVTPGHNVIIKGNGGTQMTSGLVLQVDGAAVATAKIFIDGPITLSGNDQINATASPAPGNYNWAGSLEICTTWAFDCTFSGNAQFYGCLTAPYARLVGNGGGHDQVDLCGSFVVGSVTSNGHMNFHYDEGLSSMAPEKVWGLALWKEMQTSTERALYADKLDF